MDPNMQTYLDSPVVPYVKIFCYDKLTYDCVQLDLEFNRHYRMANTSIIYDPHEKTIECSNVREIMISNISRKYGKVGVRYGRDD